MLDFLQNFRLLPLDPVTPEKGAQELNSPTALSFGNPLLPILAVCVIKSSGIASTGRFFGIAFAGGMGQNVL